MRNYLATAVRTITLSLALVSQAVWAGPNENEMQVVRFNGKVDVTNSKGVVGVLSDGQMLTAGAEIRTPAGASVELRMHNGGIMKIGERSQIQLSKLEKNDAGWRAHIKIIFGQIRAAMNKLSAGKDQFVVETPSSIAGIQGTDVIWTVQPTLPKRTTIFVLKGAVDFEDSKKNKITVKENQTASACAPGLLEVSTLSPFVMHTMTGMLPLDSAVE